MDEITYEASIRMKQVLPYYDTHIYFITSQAKETDNEEENYQPNRQYFKIRMNILILAF